MKTLITDDFYKYVTLITDESDGTVNCDDCNDYEHFYHVFENSDKLMTLIILGNIDSSL